MLTAKSLYTDREIKRHLKYPNVSEFYRLLNIIVQISVVVFKIKEIKRQKICIVFSLHAVVDQVGCIYMDMCGYISDHPLEFSPDLPVHFYLNDVSHNGKLYNVHDIK